MLYYDLSLFQFLSIFKIMLDWFCVSEEDLKIQIPIKFFTGP